MSERKTYAERIAELQARRDRLKEQERALLARQVRDEKREKTKRIFKIGTMIEEKIRYPVTEEDLDELIKVIEKWNDEKQISENELSVSDDDENAQPTANNTTEYGTRKQFFGRFQN